MPCTHMRAFALARSCALSLALVCSRSLSFNPFPLSLSLFIAGTIRQIEKLVPVTQLYVSIDAATKESLKAVDRPLFKVSPHARSGALSHAFRSSVFS